MRTGDPMSPQDGSTVLGPTYQASECGLNYTAASNKIGQRFTPAGVPQPATFAIAGIPATAVIQKAFVWCDASGSGIPVTLSVTNPVTTTAAFPMSLIGSDQDKCWGYQGTHTYRADVTSIIAGNGNYTISGFPTNPPTSGEDVDGATMMVIWSDPTASFQGDIVIWDGCVVINGGTTTQNMTGFQACSGTVSNSRAFMCVGDLQGLGSQLTLNGMAPITITEDWWNYIDVSTTVTPGQTTSAFGNSSGGDCYNFCVMGLYWQSDCQTCCIAPFTLNMTSTASQCSASNGTATATPQGGSGTFSYSWNTTPVQTTQTATGLPPGEYIVTVTDSLGCTTVDTLTVLGVGAMALTTTQVDNLCNGDANGVATVTPGGGTGPFTYAWNPNVSSSGTATGLTAGTYVVDVSDNFGCTASHTFTITEPPLVPINASVSGTTPICTGGSSLLVVNVNGGAPPYAYTWLAPAAGTNDSLTVSPATTTTFSVVVSDACSTPQDTATFTLTVNPLPTITFSGDTLGGCAPICVDFTSSSTPASVNCNWQFGDNSTATGCTPSHCYFNAGAYNVTLTVNDVNGCTNSLTQNNYINVYPNPLAGFSVISEQPATLIEATVVFDDVSNGGAAAIWYFGDGDTVVTVPGDMAHNYADTGAYHVTQIVINQYGCSDTAEYDVYIVPYTTLYVPNTFTPNGDGKNDFFFAYGEYVANFNMMIFDRWGNLIFESNDMTKGWDGKANSGKYVAQVDTYVWVVTFDEQYGGKKHRLRGHVNLIR